MRGAHGRPVPTHGKKATPDVIAGMQFDCTAPSHPDAATHAHDLAHMPVLKGENIGSDTWTSSP